MSSVWLSVGIGVPSAYTIIDYVGCNHFLLSSYLCVWRPTTVCSQTVSVQLIAIIKSRLSFAADVHGRLCLFFYETTFCAFTAVCVRFPLFNIFRSEKFALPIPVSTIILPCKNHPFRHEVPSSSNFPDSLTPSEWWTTQAETPKDSASQALQGSSGDPPQLQLTLPAPQPAAGAAHHVFSQASPPLKNQLTPPSGPQKTSYLKPKPTCNISNQPAPQPPNDAHPSNDARSSHRFFRQPSHHAESLYSASTAPIQP